MQLQWRLMDSTYNESSVLILKETIDKIHEFLPNWGFELFLLPFPSPSLAAPHPCVVCLYYNHIALCILAFLFAQRWPLISRKLFFQGKNALSWRSVLILTAKRKAVSRHAMELLVAIGARGIKMMSFCLSRTVVVTNTASEGKRLRRVILKILRHHFWYSSLSSMCLRPTDYIGKLLGSTISNSQGGCKNSSGQWRASRQLGPRRGEGREG